MNSVAWLIVSALFARAAIDLGRADRALTETARSLTAIAATYATAGDEWLTAVAKEADAFRASRRPRRPRSRPLFPAVP